MIKFPKHLFVGTTLTCSEIDGNKCRLTFYKDPFLNKKVVITFNGVIASKGEPLDKLFYNISLTDTVGIRVMNELQKLNQDHNDYEQLFISFKDGSEMLCGVKNLVIEEVEPSDITFRMRKIVMPADLNGSKTLFGGKAFSLIDEEAYVYCACQLGYNKLVTVNVSEMTFTSPAKEGDILEIGCQVVNFGKTSITVCAVVRNKTTKKDICVVDKITFVAIDDDGKPIAHGKTIEVKD